MSFYRYLRLVFALTALVSVIAYVPLAMADYTLKKHHADAGLTCEDCHGTTKPYKKVKEEKCLECHESRDAVQKRTAALKPNPHFGHVEGLQCKSCHREHTESVLFCDQCHKWGYVTP